MSQFIYGFVMTWVLIVMISIHVDPRDIWKADCL